MNKKRGRCPSLIGGTHAAPKIEIAAGTRTCKRCEIAITKGGISIVVPKPGGMGRHVYCHACILEVIEQSRKDLDAFESELKGNVTL
jgi:hypothetical protein